MGVQFWLNQTDWPNDFTEMIFLARAADQIGRALFGAEWTGTECLAESVSPIRSQDTRRINNILAAHADY